MFSQVIVRTKHIHRNDFHLTANDSIVAKKVISDDSLCGYLQFTPMKRYEFFVALYFTIYHTKIGSIISIGDLPTTNIIEPYF